MGDKRIVGSHASDRGSWDKPVAQSRGEAEVLPLITPETSWKYGVNEEDVNRSLDIALSARKVRRADELLGMLDKWRPDFSEVGIMHSEDDDESNVESKQYSAITSRVGSVHNFPKEKRSAAETAIAMLVEAQNHALQAIEENEETVRTLSEKLESESAALKVVNNDLETLRKRSAADIEATKEAAKKAVDRAILATQAEAEKREEKIRQDLESSAAVAVADAIAKAKGEVWGLIAKVVIGLGGLGAIVGIAHLTGILP